MNSVLKALALKSPGDMARLGVILALFGLILFGALRYENFLSQYNILSFFGTGLGRLRQPFDHHQHLEASRHIFSSQCKQNRHPSHDGDDANLFFLQG